MTSELVRMIEELIERARLHRSCVSCQYFNEGKELCTLDGVDLRPPARVIATGCEKYIELPPF